MTKDQDIKECKIINGRCSYILIVDGKTINFSGGHNADYFEDHYYNLGYTIIKENKNG